MHFDTPDHACDECSCYPCQCRHDEPAQSWVFAIGDRVEKPKGYPFPGTVVAAFDTLAGESRFVVESDLAPGMLHIFSAQQLTRRLDG